MSRIAGALGPALQEQAVDGLDGPDVEAAGRLDGDHQLRAGIDLARQDQPLEVAARQEARLGVDRWRRRSRYSPLRSVGDRPGRPVVDEPATRDRRRLGSSS